MPPEPSSTAALLAAVLAELRAIRQLLEQGRDQGPLTLAPREHDR